MRSQPFAIVTLLLGQVVIMQLDVQQRRGSGSMQSLCVGTATLFMSHHYTVLAKFGFGSCAAILNSSVHILRFFKQMHEQQSGTHLNKPVRLQKISSGFERWIWGNTPNFEIWDPSLICVLLLLRPADVHRPLHRPT